MAASMAVLRAVSLVESWAALTADMMAGLMVSKQGEHLADSKVAYSAD